MRLFAPLVALALLASAATAAEIAGTATVTDGDTIRIGDTRIRLWGIEAPERRQTCQGRNGEVYECGRDSTAVLNELIRGQPVKCDVKDRDRYGRVVAVCRTEAGELNAAMVRRGWAVEYKQFSKGRYTQEQAEAQREGLGIWSGRFEMPWDWRRSQRKPAARAATVPSAPISRTQMSRDSTQARADSRNPRRKASACAPAAKSPQTVSASFSRYIVKWLMGQPVPAA
jgi:endonuclease YncB( thermonuclease family)